jgi:hypothetical protein
VAELLPAIARHGTLGKKDLHIPRTDGGLCCRARPRGSLVDMTDVQAGTAEVAARRRPEVVPVRGLPVVAAVVVFVVASIAGNWLWACS